MCIFHFYVHQMLAEGIFNMHDHNKANVSSEFMAAGVNMKVSSVPSTATIDACVFVNTNNLIHESNARTDL